MADALERARRQLDRHRARRRWLPSAVIGSGASLIVAAAAAWVWPRAEVPVAPATDSLIASQLSQDRSGLQELRQALAGLNAELRGLGAATASGGALAPLPPIPALPPLRAALVAHATTGASGVP